VASSFAIDDGVIAWVASSQAGASANVFVERRGSGLPPRRVSTGGGVSAVRASGTRIGVLFNDADTFFALVDGDAKIGGDHELGSALGPSPRRILSAPSSERFVSWSASARGLVRQELVCAP
jgi:hypothetical protein